MRRADPAVPRRDGWPKLQALFGLAVDGAGGWRLARAALAAGEQLPHLVGTHRLAEIPALPDRAAERDHGLVSRLAFDPFDAHRHRKCARKGRHRADDRAVL